MPTTTKKSTIGFQTCLILYSTQSGRAKACARRTTRLLAQPPGTDQSGLRVLNGKGTTFDQFDAFGGGDGSGDRTIDLSNYLRKSTPTLLLMFVSTTGDGEHTDTIQQTWKQLLQKSLPLDLFQGVHFAIFSLGDRAYGPQKFCAAGRKLTVRLRQLGAKLWVDPGYGDDGTPNGGVFSDLDRWLDEKLFPRISLTKLSSMLPVSNTRSNIAQPTEFTALNSMHGKVSPPYRVVQGDNRCGGNAQNSTTAEWQLAAYSRFYQDFFESLRPMSSYSYSTQTNQRQSTIDDGNRDVMTEATTLLLARTVENLRLTAVHWEQNTRHIHLEVSTMPRDPTSHDGETVSKHKNWSVESLPYRAGDVAVIMPSNSSVKVDAFINVLPFKLQEIAHVDLVIEYDSTCSDINQYPGVGYQYWPKQCTLRGWLTHCADIQSLPEREDLRALATYCSRESSVGESQRQKLISLSETKDSVLYVDYILREKRSWIDVLYDFDSLRDGGSLLSIEALLGLLSPIRPRDFSIASSPTKLWANRSAKLSSTEPQWLCGFGVELCVAVVEGTTQRGRSYSGFCSSFLAQLSCTDALGRDGSNFPLWIRPGSFHGLPLHLMDSKKGNRRLETPILCIGAGTGIAPLRALIQEREALCALSGAIPDDGIVDTEDFNADNILVFGCRMKSADFYYEDEWMSLQRTGRVALLLAFSRDQTNKVYVQQVLKIEAGGRVLANHILHERGAVYVAGGPKMARAVKDLIVESIASELGERDAHKLLAKLQQKRLFSVEAWS